MSRKPNFLLIVADDLGFSDIGAFGGEIQTPCMDKLAMEGIRFTDFHAASACSPTRSMILSGTDHHIAGIGTMAERLGPHQEGKPGYEGYLNDQVAALPEILRDGGYETLMSGKWHLGMTQDRTPHARGFERSFSLLAGCHNHYAWEPEFQNRSKVPRLATIPKNIYQEDDRPVAVDDLPKDFYSSDSFTDELLSYFKDRQDREEQRPFFAYLAYSAPHWPLQAPRDCIDKYKGVYDSGPEELRNSRLTKLKSLGLIPPDSVPAPVIAKGEDGVDTVRWKDMDEAGKRYSSKTMEAYAGCVDRIDQNISRVVDYLKETNQLDDTLIMIISDNGAEGAMWEAQPLASGGNIMEHIAKYHDNSLDNIGAYNSFVWYGAEWASAATAPGRLYKMYTSEGGIRVPCIVRYPRLASPSIDHSFCTVMDILPTFLDLAGISHPGCTYRGRTVAPVAGQSWVPYLTKQSPSIHKVDSITGWELFGRMALRKGQYKALFIPKPHGPERWQVYDLKNDPGETNDLAASSPELLKELIDSFQTYALKNNVIIQSAEIRDSWIRGKS